MQEFLDQWTPILELRKLVLKELEALRMEKHPETGKGLIGKSVDAWVYLGFDTCVSMAKVLLPVGGSTGLAEVLGVSQVHCTVTDEYTLKVLPGDGERCQRCFRVVGVDRHIYWPEDLVCQRCVWTLLEIMDVYPPYKVCDGQRIIITEHEALSGLGGLQCHSS